jgi:hypothetical protein
VDQAPGITIAGASPDAATLSYMDDITLVTKGTYQFHIAYIGQFLDKLIHHGFTLNLEKCRFLQTSIQLLGHTVGRLGVSPTPTYVATGAEVADFQNFTRVKDVQAWLGLSGFYRGYLRHYAQRTTAYRIHAQVPRGVPPRQELDRPTGCVDRGVRGPALGHLQVAAIHELRATRAPALRPTVSF